MFFPNTGYCKYIYLYFFSLRFKSKQTKIWGQVQDTIKKKVPGHLFITFWAALSPWWNRIE